MTNVVQFPQKETVAKSLDDIFEMFGREKMRDFLLFWSEAGYVFAPQTLPDMALLRASVMIERTTGVSPTVSNAVTKLVWQEIQRSALEEFLDRF